MFLIFMWIQQVEFGMERENELISVKGKGATDLTMFVCFSCFHGSSDLFGCSHTKYVFVGKFFVCFQCDCTLKNYIPNSAYIHSKTF